MDVSFPQALFSGPGMTAVFTVVGFIELASLGFLLFVSYEFRKMMGRHAAFFGSMQGNGQHAGLERTAHAIFWIYIVMTLVATAVTAALFVFQPHLL